MAMIHLSRRLVAIPPLVGAAYPTTSPISPTSALLAACAAAVGDHALALDTSPSARRSSLD